MQTLALFICVLVSSAYAEAPKEKPKAAAAVKDVPALTKKLEHVVGGLEKIYDAQSKTAQGPTKFAQILKPFLTEMNGVLKEVKTDKKLSDAQKLEKLNAAEASVEGLKKDMANLTSGLKAESEEEKESLLMGVLMSRKNRPESEQLDVMKSDEFKNLQVVQYVLAHRDTKKNLVEQVATFIDSKTPAKKTAPAAKMSLQQATQEIVGTLESQLQKMEKHLADQEALHKKVTGELTESIKKDEQKLANLKGKDKKMKDAKAASEDQRKATRAMKIAKRMEKKEDRDYMKTHALMQHDVVTIKTAIESVKKGDMKALAAAQQALMHSMESMKSSTGDFLHFLQLSEWTAADSSAKDCPYCKAQCLEKCHNDGHTFMECMGQCENAGN